MTDVFQINSPNVLLLEGDSDSNFVSQLRDKLDLNLAFDIEVKQGLPRLIGAIYSEIVMGNRHIVGIMIDADHGDDPSWPKVWERLTESGILVPDQPDPNGTVIAKTDERPKVGVWIMPDNKSFGELENFVIDMIPDDDAAWPLSVKYIDGIPETERLFTERKTDRAKLYAWLATRRRPPHIGSAVRADNLDVDTDGCKSFVQWLERVFTD